MKKPGLFILILVVLVAIVAFVLTRKADHVDYSQSEQPENTTPALATSTDPVSASTTEQSIYVYMIDLEAEQTGAQETIGCGDATVAVRRTIPKTQAVLKSALEELLTTKDREVKTGSSTYYNALYQSDLQYESGSLSKEGVATIRLTGKAISGGVCDDPRIIAQIKETVEQFSTVKSSKIFINNIALEEYFSQR